MSPMIRVAPAIVFLLSFASNGTVARAQAPQFKANVRMQDGSDGTSANGVMYFGGAKVRLELMKDGENIVVLTDPVAKSQIVLMPSEKMYMQMPLGQGPISVPISGPTDPTNPCSAGSGASDCVKGDVEPVSGYEAVRWDYTAKDGTRTRAWVSTKLRFPLKTEDDNGSGMEFSNIAVGAQAASLFSIPAGYTKIDVGAMGGVGAGRGRTGGRGAGASGNPMAAAMNNMSPEMAAAMAAAMRGETPKGEVASRGSVWEKGKGWILGATLTATETKNTSAADRSERTVYSIKYTGSTPLNFGSPAVGVPGAPGPTWSLMAGAPDLGSREAEAAPLSLTMTTESTSDRTWKGDCINRGEGAGSDPGSAHATMKTTFQKSVPITQPSVELIGAGTFKIAADLKTYDLLLGFPNVTLHEVTQIHTETHGCIDKKIHKEDSTESSSLDTGASFQLTALPLPATVSVITGSKKVPLKLGGRTLDATLTWTLTPIR